MAKAIFFSTQYDPYNKKLLFWNGTRHQEIRITGDGTADSSITTHIHKQNTAAAVWRVAHNLNYQFVNVQVIDGAGNTLIPAIDYTSANAVTLTFVKPVQGTAIIRR